VLGFPKRPVHLNVLGAYGTDKAVDGPWPSGRHITRQVILVIALYLLQQVDIFIAFSMTVS
jgi:hypothetical protein